MRHNLLEALLGAIVLCFAGYFLVFAYKAGHSTSSQGYMVFAKFDRIDGLVVGNDVKISGVKVGVVEKIEVEPRSYRAKVTMSVNKDVSIPGDSSAEIVSESLLGGKYIALVPGVSQKALKVNGRISKTQSSVNLESLLSKFIFSGDKSDDKNQNKHKSKISDDAKSLDSPSSSQAVQNPNPSTPSSATAVVPQSSASVPDDKSAVVLPAPTAVITPAQPSASPAAVPAPATS